MSEDRNLSHSDVIALTAGDQLPDISSLGWCPLSPHEGMLLIGCNDGTCMTLTLDADVNVVLSGWLELEKDYRSVEHMQYIKVK